MEYYVYFLIDPRDDEIFYVGKGKGNRRFHHEAEARKGVYSRKCNRIREIIGGGLQVRADIIERFAIEADAYAREAEMIARIGLENLTNVLPGGAVIRSIRPPKGYRPWTEAMVRKVAPRIARAIKLIETTGGMMVAGRDMTQFVRSLAQKISDDCPDGFMRAMLPYGIGVVYADA